MATWYERLSILDCSFLAFESANAPMHIAAVAVFSAASFDNGAGGVDLERIRRYVASRLPSTPRYRQRLAYIPVENHHVWVDDAHFDLAYHVRHTSVPRPGGTVDLQELCARLLERPLDRSKPLWEIWVIEGLDGGRFALLMKVHHCMADGVGGVELLAALLHPTSETAIETPPVWQPRPAPSHAQLLRDEVARRTRMSFGWIRRWRPDGGNGHAGLAPWIVPLQAAWDLVRDGLRRPVETPLNQRLGPHRRLHWMASDLGALKEVKNALGGTLNDVVLSIVGGAVGAFFKRRGFAADGLDFRVAVPVNMRAAAEHTAGNRVSAWLVPLPIHESRSTRRLQAVQGISRHLKDTNHASGVQMLMETAEWTSTNLLTLGVQLSRRMQPYDLIVTNVPGPQFPLYLLGARMEAIYPQVPLFENQSLGIAVFSYDGQLFWGFNADWDALPDLHEFVQDIDASFRHLRRAAQRRRRQHADVSLPRRPIHQARSAPLPSITVGLRSASRPGEPPVSYLAK